jgi:tRNA pseudouridine38-40 synthase
VARALDLGEVSALRTFRLTLAYDGTAYRGWQKQPDVRTVQGELEAALARVLGEKVMTAGAGRTDTGVHARGQVVSFKADTAIPAHAFTYLVNRHLPEDARVMAAVEAPEGFHARHSARARRYEYRVLASPDILRMRSAWCPKVCPSLEVLQATAAPIRGAHDFTAFQAAGNDQAVATCDVRLAEWRPIEGGLAFDVVADHFLYHMVRKLVGTAFEAATKDDPAGHVADILASRDRRRAGRMVPAMGLSLEQVYYEGEEYAS